MLPKSITSTPKNGGFSTDLSVSGKTHRRKRFGHKNIKHHDFPKTPYQRIIASAYIHESVKLSLCNQLKNFNPLMIKNHGQEIKNKGKIKKMSVI
jgi:hypothetical protein